MVDKVTGSADVMLATPANRQADQVRHHARRCGPYALALRADVAPRLPSSKAELRTLQVTGQLAASDLAALPPVALGRIADALRGAFAPTGAPHALPAGDDQEDDEDVLEAVPAEFDQPNV